MNRMQMNRPLIYHESNLYYTVLICQSSSHYNIAGTKKDEIKVAVTEIDGRIYSKAISNIKRGDLMFSMPLGVCLDVNKAVMKFGPLTSKLRTGKNSALSS